MTAVFGGDQGRLLQPHREPVYGTTDNLSFCLPSLRCGVRACLPIEAIEYSDPCSQFRSRSFGTTLLAADLQGLMGRVTSATDHAAVECSVALLPDSDLNGRAWGTREQVHLATMTWIERKFHRRS